MWKTINSPIIITLVLLIALASYNQFRKNTAASELRAVYEELISISEDAKDDLARKKLIEGVVKEAAKQIKEGFSSFSSDEDKKKKAEENKRFFKTKNQLVITTSRIVNVQKKVIYQIKNGSKDYLSRVAHTVELYNQGELVEVKEEWGNIKYAPGDTKSYSYTVHDKELIFDNAKVAINDITIMELAQ